MDTPLGPDALSARGLETLEARYQRWLELRLEHGTLGVRHAEEQARLTQQGEFLVGAVRHAGGGAPAGAAASGGEGTLAPAGGLERFLAEAEEKLAQAKAALAARIAADEAGFAQRFSEVKQAIAEQLERTCARVKPSLHLRVRALAGGKAIVHVDRVRPDEAVLLARVLTGKIPTRYEFLFDDSTEALSLPPPPLYPEEGVTEVRPDAQALKARVMAPGLALPVKGFLPVLVPGPRGEPELFRLLQRGVVMEVEREDGAGFRNVLTRDEAERFAGAMLRLKLEGRIELELEAG